jgi:surfeit locus 1 family protein
MSPWRRLLIPAISTAAMTLIMVGLGTWQVQRLAWKRGILDEIARAESEPAIPLPADPSPFAKVEVQGTFRPDLAASYGAEVRDMPEGPVLGGQLIMPLERPGDKPLLVDRGWVPLTRKQAVPTPQGMVTVSGYVRPADHPGLFSAADDLATRQFFTLNPEAIGSAVGLPGVAPFTLVALGPKPEELYPDPARHLPRPPNNHLQYALTWYSLAVTLLVIFALYARKVLRG